MPLHSEKVNSNQKPNLSGSNPSWVNTGHVFLEYSQSLYLTSQTKDSTFCLILPFSVLICHLAPQFTEAILLSNTKGYRGDNSLLHAYTNYMKSCHSNRKISTSPALLCLPNPSSGLCCQSILDEARLTVSVRASKSDNRSYCSDNKEETQLRLVFKGQVFTSFIYV